MLSHPERLKSIRPESAAALGPRFRNGGAVKVVVSHSSSRWHESYNVHFRVGALNFANHPNFNNQAQALGSAGSGVIRGAKDQRILQLGLRAES
jgi:hypothetical protein